MKFFVKAKFPVEPRADGIKVVPEKKDRFHTRELAFEFAAVCMDDGAVSVTIRPEQ